MEKKAQVKGHVAVRASAKGLRGPLFKFDALGGLGLHLWGGAEIKAGMQFESGHGTRTTQKQREQAARSRAGNRPSWRPLPSSWC